MEFIGPGQGGVSMDPRFDRRRPRHTGGPSSHEGALPELSQCQDGSVSLLPHIRLVKSARDGFQDVEDNVSINEAACAAASCMHTSELSSLLY